MKQLIVLISTVVLGVFIAGMVLGFRTPAEKLTGNVMSQLDTIGVVSTKAGLTVK